MIEVKHVSFSYADGTEALKDIHVGIPPEHTFAILGQSGSGKTTLLNCIGRFLSPQKGEILLNGQDIQTLARQDFRSQVGVVFQNLNLFPHLTIMENLILAPVKVQKRPAKDVKSDARAMLERLGVADVSASFPNQISGGQAQRVAIARGLMLRPQYMLLDEPTSALDAKTTDEFADWLRELRADTSFVAVTHDLRFVRRASEHGIALRDGRVICHGDIADVVKSVEEGIADAH